MAGQLDRDPKTRGALKSISEPAISLPGDTVKEGARAALYGRITEYSLVALFVLFLAVYEWVRKMMKTEPQPVLVSFFAGGLFIYALVRIWLIVPKIKALNRDKRGRERLGEVLNELGELGYYSFRGLVDDYGAVIGTVLVGAQGVFVLETKTYSRRGAPLERVEGVGNDRVLISGNEAIGNPMRQARASARRVQTILEKKTHEAFEVRPVLIFPGWTIGRTDESSDVWIVNEDTLAPKLKGSPKLEAREVLLICEVLQNVSDRN